MPASLYNLVNRKHHSDASDIETVAVEAPVSELQNQNDAQVVEAPVVVVEPATVEADEVDAQEEQAVEETVEVNFPNWDVSWSKTQLLAVAQSMNLSVTSVSTKTEIVNALTAATKAR